ncbi:MAG: acyltransferase family protein [Alphaproteobacteria bacterium]|jgi:glucans biosynthesis protein C|nr:acyltransferase family protein [Alphaproteobacteria bacterium]MBU2041601.1 acyltransferase family protein [Alphaproteobacteria bacterium]MBU2124570.1 acyltransferase family protein [Alphaproteobacteria bacterium]MBU2209479.1 acyltransferase family protein [Alphaproteobacteria bacterium]MBU2290059.1 acyltransferase family protein [Alphaproteobacteria bacterium]
MSSSETRPSDRLHGLDALRGTALLLGVVLHAAMSYFPVTIWIVPDTDNSPVAGVIFFAIHLFRMTTFFLIAGLFAHMMLGRRGTLGFIKDRLMRIAGPLAVFWTPVLAAIIAGLVWMAAIRNGGSIPTDGPPPPPLTLETFPLTHLWFLWVLLILYVGMLVLRAPFALADRDGGWGRFVDRITGALIGPWTPALMAAPLALAFWLAPNWTPFFGIPTPDTGLVPNATALTAFGTAFGLGFLLDRRRDLLVRIERLWPVFTVVALGVGTAALVMAGGPVPDLTPVTDPALKAPLAAVMALAVFATVFAVLSLALRFASGYSAVRRYLADSSYWVYIVHLPLVMVGQILVVNETWPWFVKFGVVIGGTMAVSLLTYELLVRHSFVGGWLNGRRMPWSRQRDPEFSPAE